MPTLANDLVLFLMSLFGNQQAAKEFLDNPERALDNAGLGGVCSSDVDAAMPVILDFAPINASSFDRSYNTGGNRAETGGGVAVTPPHGGGHGHRDDDHDDDHDHAVQQLHNVVNNYSWETSVDDRDTITDQSVNQNIWAEGDVEQWFDNDSVVASGDRAVAAGDDVDIEDSNNVEDSYNTDNSNDSSTDNSVEAGRDANVDNEETNIEDSFNTDVDIDDSLNDESDNRVDNSETSFELTDNSDSSVDVSDIGNTTVQDNVVVAGNEITTTEVEVGDVEAEFTNIEESVIVAENTLEVSPEITAEDDSEINL